MNLKAKNELYGHEYTCSDIKEILRYSWKEEAKFMALTQPVCGIVG
jgi:hypothetical protein